MSLLRSLISARSPLTGPLAFRPSLDTAWPFANIGGRQYPLQTLLGDPQMISPTFAGYISGMFAANPAVFACEMARINLFTEARFQWRRMNSGRPGDLFGTAALDILEKPWAKATTADLLATMLLYADFGGNCFIVRRPGALRPLRPDWVDVVLGSMNDPGVAEWDIDAEMVGIVYYPGGFASGRRPSLILAEDFAHFKSSPNGLRANGLGMPWVASITSEVKSHAAATEFKQKFFEHGASPNLLVTVDKAYSNDQVKALRAMIEERHEGVRNAYRTLILRGSIENAAVIGKDLGQVTFKEVQGASETAIASAAQVPPVVAGLSEGLQGSSLNAGNFAASMRRFADLTVRPLWRNASGSLEAIVPPPTGASLWYDDRDIPALKDDIRDAAEVQGLQATAIATLTRDGYEAESVVRAITAGDLRLLKHTGQFSVQLRPPGGKEPPATPQGGAT